MNIPDIAVIAETNNYEEANKFLKLGWKLLQTSSGYFFEESLEYKEIEKIGYTSYSLGWEGDSAEVEYPESYLQDTAPF